MQWFIVYVRMTRDVPCVYVPEFKGEIVIVTCLKSVPCHFVEATWQVQYVGYTEQERLALLLLHNCVLRWISLRQEHEFQYTIWCKLAGVTGKGC